MLDKAKGGILVKRGICHYAYLVYRDRDIMALTIDVYGK